MSIMNVSTSGQPPVAIISGRRLSPFRWRTLSSLLAATVFTAGVWYGIPQLDPAARFALIIFGLTVGASVAQPV
jgi:hypothetical protein